MPSYVHALIACAVATSCARTPDAAGEIAAAPEQFPVGVPRVGEVVLQRSYVADVRAGRHAEVRARFKGVIEAVPVDEGDAVRAGQVLFAIDARVREQDVAVARAAVVGAKAELTAAELELDNTRLLADKHIVSAAELARVKARVELRKAKVEEAKANVGRATVELDRAQIRAPFDGIVNRIEHKAGSAIEENALLTTVSDAREVVAYFAISEREYLDYANTEDQEPVVRLALADNSMFDHEGVIDAVGSEIDAATGTLSYRARFPNPQGTLKHGSSGKVVLETRLPGAVLIPQRSTFEIQGNVYAYVLEGEDVVRARKLDVQGRSGDAFVIGTSIAPSERFVVEGIQRLKDGARIVPAASVTTPPPPAAPRQG